MIIVLGVPGVGKSAVLNVAKDAGYKVLNWGDLMVEAAMSRHGIKSRDEMRKLPAYAQSEIQREVGQKLATITDPKVVLDTHCSINTPKGYLPGLPMKLITNLQVERLVLLTAPIEDIISRRKADKTRVRDDQTPESLAEHLSMNNYYLACYSFATGAPAIIIQNPNGRLEETQAKFKALL